MMSIALPRVMRSGMLMAMTYWGVWGPYPQAGVRSKSGLVLDSKTVFFGRVLGDSFMLPRPPCRTDLTD